MKPLFITGIGTGIGKTVWSAVITEALEADYWKPVQAGFEEGTDTETVSSLISNTSTIVHNELYKLKLAASPHIAAREEKINLDLDLIVRNCNKLAPGNKHLVIEGAGGLMVPLNEKEFVIDLIRKLNARVLLVSRNYLGSINHSLLTANTLKQEEIEVIGWLFNDRFMNYEDELEKWTSIPNIGSLPMVSEVNSTFVKEQAASVRKRLIELL